MTSLVIFLVVVGGWALACLTYLELLQRRLDRELRADREQWRGEFTSQVERLEREMEERISARLGRDVARKSYSKFHGKY